MTGGTHTSAGTEQAPELRLEWRSGAPTKPWSEEWFIAETIWGDRVVLRALPEEWTYDFKTADDTYIKHDKIKRWMPFPDSEFIAPDVPVVAQSVGRPGRLQLIAEADGVLSVGNAMDMSISGAWAFVQKARDFLAAQPPAAPVDQERLAELQNEAGMYKSLYENAIAQRSSAVTIDLDELQSELTDSLKPQGELRPLCLKAAEAIAELRSRAAPQTSSMEDVRQLAEIAIRTFCQSLGAGSVTIAADGVERIYHAGINLRALSVAVAMAVTRPKLDAGAGPHPSQERNAP
jgi:hypothetical protein